MKITKKQLHKLIQEEIATMSSETSIEEQKRAPVPGNAGVQDMIHDLVDAMMQTGQKWLTMASRGQTPETAEKLEQVLDLLEQGLKSQLAPVGYDDDEGTYAKKGAFAAMDADRRNPTRENKNRTKVRTKKKK